MKKDKLKLIFILILAAFLFSCSKEIKEQKPEETKVETSTKIEPKENEFLSKPEYNTHVKSPEQIKELEEKYKKSKAYEESLKQLRTELDKKEKILRYKCPVFMSIDNLAQQKAPALYSSVYNLEFIHFYEIKKEGEFCYCKYKAPTQNGGTLDYQVTYKWYNIEQMYLPLSYDLLSETNMVKINDELIENQVHGSIYSMENDEKKDEMIKLFEDYENTRYPLYFEVVHTDWDTGVKTMGYKQYDMKILDYVKGNFTNSGYDEYFVMFYEDAPDPEIYDQFIERVRCFVVDEDKIIKDYYITVPSASFFPPHIERGGLFGLKNFGFEFSQGWVSDFNQNGKNEIYFVTHFSTGRNFLFIIEFNGEFFVTGYVYDNDYDVVSVDWYKKMIIIKDKSRSGEWIDDYQWNDTLKEFILLKRKY
ncbi:clustered-type lipoprotein [Treponema denticola]|uniref:clustered-type lipoprotein n=1 Tax=Treponema denticola TaxID=158 RepID=UPI0020A3177E|nr:clustered-type lipoprotein [Treponema denticola]UTC83649.1 clustered-type lipoprotein [Treponema denticola]